MNDHKDIVIALAENGADLNIKSKVSDCYLRIHCDDHAGNVETLITAMCTHTCSYLLCVCMHVQPAMCMHTFLYVHIHVYDRFLGVLIIVTISS